MLNRQQYKTLVDILTKLMTTERERRAILTAVFRGNPLLIDIMGDARTVAFATIEYLTGYTFDDGELGLLALLQTLIDFNFVRNNADQVRLEEIIRSLNTESPPLPFVEDNITTNIHSNLIPVEINPSQALDLYNDLEIETYRENWHKVIEIGEQLLQVAPTKEKIQRMTAEAYYMRGTQYYEEKDYDRALEDFDKAIELDDLHGGYHVARYLVHRELGNQDQAERDYGAAEQLGHFYPHGD